MNRLEPALRALDEANRRDPRTQPVGGISHPREWIFAQRVYGWIERLDPDASEAVRLAARSHTLRRWEIPRDRYPMDTAGYHAWRGATADHSAAEASKILRACGCGEEVVRSVSRLIRRELFPQDPDAQLLEDADCLAFLEIKLADYLGQWDEPKLYRILAGTWRKMSPAAREAALRAPFPPNIATLLQSLA